MMFFLVPALEEEDSFPTSNNAGGGIINHDLEECESAGTEYMISSQVSLLPPSLLVQLMMRR